MTEIKAIIHTETYLNACTIAGYLMDHFEASRPDVRIRRNAETYSVVFESEKDYLSEQDFVKGSVWLSMNQIECSLVLFKKS